MVTLLPVPYQSSHILFLGHQLQPHDANSLYRGHRFRQDKPKQGNLKGSYEEKEGKAHGTNEVRRTVQERKEQVVLPQIAILKRPTYSHFLQHRIF